MGKNYKGGNKQKTLANKNAANDHDDIITPGDTFQKLAIVTKVLGCGMFHVDYFDIHDHETTHKTSLAHIRGNMKGPKKRFNLVNLHSIVLIQLRHYETSPKNSDIIHVYSNHHYITLLQNYPVIHKHIKLLTAM